MKQRFKGLVAWITGGGSGLGRALAHELARQGARVAVSGRRMERLQQVVDSLRSSGAEALALPCDVTDETEVQRAVQGVVDHWGRLDVVVANAGYGVTGPFKKIPLTQWKRQLDVNVLGVVAVLSHALPHLEKTSGRAVVVSSVLGRMGVARQAPYCTSKYALVGLCDCLFQELYGSGVSVTNIMPGLVESEIAMVDNNGVFRPGAADKRPRRLMWTAERAAAVMADGIFQRRRQVVFTFHGKVGAFLGQHVPGLLYPVLARLGVRGRG